jgi:cytochrome c biogenesis protein CcmG/thiol:disulfide interchange protein DsbE
MMRLIGKAAAVRVADPEITLSSNGRVMETKAPDEVKGENGEEKPPSPSSRRRSIQPLILVAGLVVLASLVYGLMARGPGPLTEGPAPDFTVTLFEGGQLTLSELQGQVVVVNFWASWCPPCRTEAPIFESAWQRYRERGVTFIGLNYQDTEPPARAFIEEFGITYPNGPDERSRIAGAYGLQGVPETFIISPEGEIAEVFIGSPTEAQLTAVLDELLTSATEQ